MSLLCRYRGVWARRNASLTVHSKGTNADETNGPAEGVEEWWDGAKSRKHPPLSHPSYDDGNKDRSAEKSSAFIFLRSFSSLSFHNPTSSPLPGPM